jgi:hypothetical protein
MNDGVHPVAPQGIEQQGKITQIAAHDLERTAPESSSQEIRMRLRIEEDDRLAAL